MKEAILPYRDLLGSIICMKKTMPFFFKANYFAIPFKTPHNLPEGKREGVKINEKLYQ